MQASTGPKEVANDLDVNVTVSSSTDKTTPIDSSIGDVILPEHVMQVSTGPQEVAIDFDANVTAVVILTRLPPLIQVLEMPFS